MIDVPLESAREMLRNVAMFIGMIVMCVGSGVIAGSLTRDKPGLVKNIVISATVFVITTLVFYALFGPQ